MFVDVVQGAFFFYFSSLELLFLAVQIDFIVFLFIIARKKEEKLKKIDYKKDMAEQLKKYNFMELAFFMEEYEKIFDLRIGGNLQDFFRDFQSEPVQPVETSTACQDSFAQDREERERDGGDMEEANLTTESGTMTKNLQICGTS